MALWRQEHRNIGWQLYKFFQVIVSPSLTFLLKERLAIFLLPWPYGSIWRKLRTRIGKNGAWHCSLVLIINTHFLFSTLLKQKQVPILTSCPLSPQSANLHTEKPWRKKRVSRARDISVCVCDVKRRDSMKYFLLQLWKHKPSKL